MSIYSGFATRHQEESYDQLVEDLIFVLQKRILKFYRHETADEDKFLEVLKHIHTQLAKMEQHKYLEPKTSKSFDQMLRYLQIQHNNNPNAYQSQPYITPNKDSQTAPLRMDQRLRSHRETLSQANQIGTVGKIIHQIPRKHGDQSNHSLADSRNTFWNPQTNKKNQEQKSRVQSNNPQAFEKEQLKKTFINSQQTSGNDFLDNSRRRKKNQTSLKGLKFHSNGKLPKDKEKTQDYLIDYLEKNSKNYLRGYRKRQVKTRQFSSKEHSSRV